MLACKQTPAAKDALKHLVTMGMNQNHSNDSVEGQWSMVSIEQII